MDRRGAIAAVAYHLIKSNRRAGWEARMRSNLDRWEDSITRLKSAQDKIKRNIRKNQESLEKAENFFNNLNSEAMQPLFTYY